MDILDYPLQQAAHTALQVVNHKLALQTLQPVLADLASDQSLVRQLNTRRNDLQYEIDTLTQERDRLGEEAQRHREQAKRELAEQKETGTAILDLLKADIQRHEERLASLKQQIANGEEQLASVRAAARAIA